MDIQFIPVTSPEDYRTAAALFREYEQDIGIDLEFQNFEDELKQLGNQYAPPSGGLYLVQTYEHQTCGCFGVRAQKGSIAELKRMYLKPEARGKGISKKMLHKSFEVAKRLGYTKMRLDTLDSMKPAIGLYKNAGFYEIPAYCFNPLEGALYFEVDLTEMKY